MNSEYDGKIIQGLTKEITGRGWGTKKAPASAFLILLFKREGGG